MIEDENICLKKYQMFRISSSWSCVEKWKSNFWTSYCDIVADISIKHFYLSIKILRVLRTYSC